MTISRDTLPFLTSDQGTSLLASLAQEDLAEPHTLRLLSSLRKHYSASEAGAALEMARLRRKAAAKFGEDAARMWFTRDALEQASDPQVRDYRAQAAAGRTVVDACCSIGVDSLAMARAGGNVLGLDIDPLRVALARLNAAALGLSAQFDLHDVRTGIPPSQVAFYDSARRDEDGRRIHHVEQYRPPLSLVRTWSQPLIAVKLSPGVDLAQIESYGGRVEFISADGDLKEATLWLGEGHGTEATLLTATGEYHWRQAAQPASAPIDEPRSWLLEPDPALLRAGLVADLALHLGGAQLDETIAYLTTDEKPDSPWVRAWKVRDWLPFGVKPLRAYLRERGVGQVTVKKRGTAVTPEALIPQLKLKGDETRTLVLTRCRGKQIVLICDDITVER